ncbi:MAG: DUF1206 domain-containing protein [Pseudomonadota bacterium]
MDYICIPAEFKWWAKMGYVARGIIYLVIGGLAVLTALGMGGDTTDSKGAILAILEQPFGSALLMLLIIGLFGYSAWRLIQAVRDTDGHGTSLKGIGIRLALFGSSITHALLAVWAISLVLKKSVPGGESFGQMSSGTGQLAFGGVGIICVVAGLAHFYKGWRAGFERYMNLPQTTRFWARPVCRFGLIARGVVWCIVGWFFFDSAMRAQQDQIRGIGEALASLQTSGQGPWLLLTVACGLVAFGIYSCLEALYRRINTG